MGSKPDRVQGVPLGQFNGVGNTEKQADKALYLIEQLAKRNLVYLHVSESDSAGGEPLSEEFRAAVRKAWPGVLIGAGGYTADKAADLVRRGLIDAAAFGRACVFALKDGRGVELD